MDSDKRLRNNDQRESFFGVVGLDAADVVRRGGVQRLHQHLQRISELKPRRGVSDSRLADNAQPTVNSVTGTKHMPSRHKQISLTDMSRH